MANTTTTKRDFVSVHTLEDLSRLERGDVVMMAFVNDLTPVLYDGYSKRPEYSSPNHSFNYFIARTVGDEGRIVGASFREPLVNAVSFSNGMVIPSSRFITFLYFYPGHVNERSFGRSKGFTYDDRKKLLVEAGLWENA